uniref:Large ribosomal subunit protein mL54 n=1 Tax=Phallusia mammillata TaxID=59560 RepID=A0A6F9DLX3_9ASCI|nr:39S ribosomal protein L54, mitochondrial [Phallusia mammillata]
MIARKVSFGISRCIQTSAINPAKLSKTASKALKATAVKQPKPVTDAHLLTTRCCGLNKFKEGEDPELKPDSEYPDWLWDIKLGKPEHYTEMDPTTKEYWWALANERRYMINLPKKGKGFSLPPKPHELSFKSRLPLKTPEEKLKEAKS